MRYLSHEAGVREHSCLQTGGKHRDQGLHFPLFPGGLLLTSKLGTYLLSEERDGFWRGSNAIGIWSMDSSILRFRKTCCLQHLKSGNTLLYCAGGSRRSTTQTMPFPVLSEGYVHCSHRVACWVYLWPFLAWGWEEVESRRKTPRDFGQTILGLPLALTGVTEGRDKRQHIIWLREGNNQEIPLRVNPSRLSTDIFPFSR